MRVIGENFSNYSQESTTGVMLNVKILVLIKLSALLLASAFFLPSIFAWCIFVFLIPLYYVAFKYPLLLTFKHGIWWGIFFIGIHFSGVALFFWKECSRFRFIPGLLIIAYFTFHAGVWFAITRLFVSTNKKSVFWICMCWTVTTFCFFYWYKYYSMWFFGIYTNGYCFGSPLLPLAQYPQLLKGLSFIGESGLILLLIISQLFLSLGILKKQYTYLLSLFFLIPFWAGFFIAIDEKAIPAYVNSIAYVKVPSRIDSYEQALALDFQIAALTHQNPAIKHIVMPETSFNKCINVSDDLMRLMTLNSCNKDINIFVGAHRRENVQEFNSLYWLKKGKIESYYDKKIRMPFSEFVPYPWNQSLFLKKMFLKGWEGYASQEKLNTGFELSKDFSFIPCICSDFYFDSTQRFSEYNPAHPILLLIGELWASTDYLKRLMHLYAVYHSIQLQKDILYVGYTMGCWINKYSGKSVPLYS